MNEAPTEAPKKRGRGPGKRPKLFNTSVRIQRYVQEYFIKYHPKDKQAKMREILAEYVNKQLELKEQQDGTQETFNV